MIHKRLTEDFLSMSPLEQQRMRNICKDARTATNKMSLQEAKPMIAFISEMELAIIDADRIRAEKSSHMTQEFYEGVQEIVKKLGAKAAAEFLKACQVPFEDAYELIFNRKARNSVFNGYA